ncbi:MAG: acyltransferase [Micavibrio sp.]|nr:MAG: acyltransferase [Micavibrio sp.]
MTNNADRIAVLDGLRGLAIILVLFRHGIMPFWEDTSQPFWPIGPIDPGLIFLNGWIGVDLFFVLSGFLITTHLLGRYFNEDKNNMKLGSYFKRRFFRVAPVYYLVLTLVCIGFFPLYPYPESTDNLWWRYAYHLAFMQDYLPSDITIVFWTLAVEIKFYLLAPFVLMGLLRLPSARLRYGVLIGLLMASPVLRYLSAEYILDPFDDYASYFLNMRSFFHLSLDGLIVGMLAAMAWKEQAVKDYLARPFVADNVFYGGLGVILVLVLSGPLVDLGGNLFNKVFLVSFLSLGFGGMLMGLVGGCKASKIFSKTGLRFMGLISYSLYLFHLPMLYMAEMLASRLIDFSDLAAQVMFILYMPFFLGLSVIVATLSYLAIERTFIDWAHKPLR